MSDYGGGVLQTVQHCGASHVGPGSFEIVCGSAKFNEISLADCRIALFHKPRVSDRLSLDESYCGMAALPIVEIEQTIVGLAHDDACELACQIDPVVDAAIHAK